MHRQAEGGNPFNPGNLTGGSASRIISQWLLDSLQQKQQLWQRNSPEIVTFQGTESFRDVCLSIRKSWNSSVMDTVAGSPLKERLVLPCPYIHPPRAELFDLEKVKWKAIQLWLAVFRHCGSPGKEKDYYLRKGFCVRTHKALFSTQGVEDNSDTYQGQ